MLAAHPDKAVRLSPKLAYLGGTQQPEPPSHEHGGLGMQRTPPLPPQKHRYLLQRGGRGGWGYRGGLSTQTHHGDSWGGPHVSPTSRQEGVPQGQPEGATPAAPWGTLRAPQGCCPSPAGAQVPQERTPPTGPIAHVPIWGCSTASRPLRKPEEEEKEEEGGGGGGAALRGTHRAGRAAVGPPPPLLRGSASSRGSPSPSRSRSPSPSRSGSRSGSWACSGTVSGT